MKDLLNIALTALVSADAALKETRPLDGHDDPGAIEDCKKNVADAIVLLKPLQEERSELMVANNPNYTHVPGIAPLELELLRAVLPEPYTIVNEGTEDLSIYDGDDWQYRIGQWETAKSLIAKIIAVTSASAKAWGVAEVQVMVKKALGIPEDIARAVEAAKR